MRRIAGQFRLYGPITIGLALAAGLSSCAWFGAADAAAPAEAQKSPRTRVALHAAVDKNLGYCRDWLAEKDWKSLRQTADGVSILVQVLAPKGDDEAWRRAVRGFLADVENLQSASDEKQGDKCRELIAGLEAQNKSLAKLEPKSAAKSGKLSITLRSLMALMDATHADAKTSVAVGELDAAKNMAVVLSELGRVVSNQRADAAWHSSAEALVSASAAAADERQTDAKAIRQQLRGVYEKCEACHERHR
jgi:hypothetical protein